MQSVPVLASSWTYALKTVDLGSYCYECPVVVDVAPNLTRPPSRSIIVTLANGSYRRVYFTDVTDPSAYKRGTEILLTIYYSIAEVGLLW